MGQEIDTEFCNTETKLVRLIETAMGNKEVQCKLHEKRLDVFEKKQDANSSKIDTVITQNKAIFKLLDKFDKIVLTGNGKPGLMTRIEVIEEKHEEHIKQGDEDKKDKKFNIANIITIIIAILMAFITIWSVYHTESKIEREVNRYIERAK